MLDEGEKNDFELSGNSKMPGFERSAEHVRLYANSRTGSNSLIFNPTVYDYLGCWQHHGSNFLPEISLLHQKGHDTSLLHRCANAARLSGIPVFGITNNSVCVGSVHASLIYMRYGPSTACYNGTGGPSTMDVYGLDGKNISE